MKRVVQQNLAYEKALKALDSSYNTHGPKPGSKWQGVEAGVRQFAEREILNELHEHEFKTNEEAKSFIDSATVKSPKSMVMIGVIEKVSKAQA